jgi:methionyl-tRNA synthetase
MEEATPDTIFKRDKGQSRNWEDWWKSPDSVIYNFMGQDNLVFHALMWPGQLMGLNDGYQLPKYVVVNKFLNYEGKKFSKSRNWTIDSKVIAEKYGVDLVRYYIARNLPENKEGNFTWEDFVASVNNELVANLGNLVNRTLTFIKNKFNGEIEVDPLSFSDELSSAETFERVVGYLSGPNNSAKESDFENGPWIVKAFDEIMELSRKGNVYFDQKEVWQVIKSDENEAKVILMNLVNLIYDLGVLIYPFLPETSNKIMKLLNVGDITTKVGTDMWTPSVNKKLNKIKLKEVELLFNKLDPEKVLTEKDNTD